MSFVTFTGLSGTQRCIYTASHGFRPGVAVVTCRPQAITTMLGTLVLSDGTTSLTLTNALMDQTTARRTMGGTRMKVQIYDRRWRWGFGCALGTWNVRDEYGDIDAATQKSVRELVERLFDEGMGEPSVDVTALPADEYPPVEWKGEKAWVACQRLLALYNCDVVFDPGSDTVYVVQLGSGAGLPTGKEQSVALSADFNPWPDKISIYSGRMVIESLFELAAVGLDEDTLITAADDLSYAPSGGWAGKVANPLNLIPKTTNKLHYGLANRTVGRWFQVSDVSLPTDITATTVQHCLPLRRNRIASYTDSGEVYNSPPLLMGLFAQLTGTPRSLVNTAAWTEYEGEFRVDRMRGIVMTKDPVWKLSGTGLDFPDLYLLTSHYIQTDEKQFARYFLEATLASNGTPTEQSVRDEYYLTSRGVYVNGALTDTITNESDLYAILNSELMAWAAGYSSTTGKTVGYGGIKAVTLTGQVRAASWVVDMDVGSSTMASENTEYLAGVKPLIQRRRDGESEPRRRSSQARRRQERAQEV